jgi:putative transcriptional regulator
MSLNLEHHFLVAMPEMDDPYFNHAVVYIIQHDSNGALGLVVNKPVATLLTDVAQKMGVSFPSTHRNDTAYYGGPVSRNQALILSRHTGDDDTSYSGHGLSVSGSPAHLSQLMTDDKSEFILCLGYTGWGPGQMESELEDHVWIACPADNAILFHQKDAEKRDLALKKMGINPAFLK